MRLGIISEGTTEQAVIENILVGLGMDDSDILPIRPNLNFDETDLANNEKTIGTWQGVKNSCLELKEIEDFLLISGNEFIIIQIDTAECGEIAFGVNRPNKNSDSYVIDFRNAVIAKVSTWLNNKYQSNIVYAICIEEIEAWILTAFTTDNRDTGLSANPKKKFKDLFGEKLANNKTGTSSNFDFYIKLTKHFRKGKDLKKFSLKNASLQAFINDIEDKVLEKYFADNN